MIINPEKLVFECTNDVVDYIGRGLPPTRKQFDRLMEAVENPIEGICDPDSPELQGRVIIRKEDISNWTNNMFVRMEVNKVLQEMYANRIRNRNIAIGIGAVALLVGLIFSSGKKSEKDSEE